VAPGTLYVEGIAPSATARDVELRLEYDENPEGQSNSLFKCEDRVKLTVLLTRPQIALLTEIQALGAGIWSWERGTDIPVRVTGWKTRAPVLQYEL
jgi:hypothetical protein